MKASLGSSTRTCSQRGGLIAKAERERSFRLAPAESVLLDQPFAGPWHLPVPLSL
jgi:hypothetical protein